MPVCTTRTKTTTSTAAKASLTLAIGPRTYRVRLEWWSADECHVVYLDDLATGQATRVKDLSNITPYTPGRTPASCSCSPHRPSVECRHVRALRAVHVLPNQTRTEGEDD